MDGGSRWKIYASLGLTKHANQDLLVSENTYQYYNPSFQHIEGDWRNPERVKILHDHYTTTEVSNHAHKYLKKAMQHEKPFFVGIAPITPHVQTGKDGGRPPVPAKRFEGTMKVPVPRADNFNPANVCGSLTPLISLLTSNRDLESILCGS
jgi:N-acetylglucosamine-6-sulfatase